ncbi:hypothetical protein [Sphingobacterium sp. UBA6645]|uniref:hypothetical protein n=1 Tax=Sphingobacterium sp. UBA6645 TaxID=1947511 RepID=UPI0025E587D7|nr:hypothetical protein [Sphingobacterium sp. UBA6645]
MAYVEYEADGKTIKARVQQKTDTLANWEANTKPILAGEQAFVIDGGGTPINFKIGDGTKKFSELPWWISYDQGQYVQVVGNALPTPTVELGYSFVGPGTYTHAGGNVVAPEGRFSQIVFNGSTWSLKDMGELPDTNKIPNLVSKTYVREEIAVDADGVMFRVKPSVPSTTQPPSLVGGDWEIVAVLADVENNLFNLRGFIEKGTGNFVPDVALRSSVFLRIKEASDIKLSGYSGKDDAAALITFYTADREYISYLNSTIHGWVTDFVITEGDIPTNAYYVRITKLPSQPPFISGVDLLLRPNISQEYVDEPIKVLKEGFTTLSERNKNNYFNLKGYIEKNGGTFQADSSLRSSIFLKIDGGKDIVVTGYSGVNDAAALYSFYDENFNHISSGNALTSGNVSDFIIEHESIPSNAVYARFTRNSTQYPFVDGVINFMTDQEIQHFIHGNLNNLSFVDSKKDYFNILGYVKKSDGFIEKHETFRSTRFLKLKGTEDLVITGYSGRDDAAALCAFYDENYDFISFVNASNQGGVIEFVVVKESFPTNAVYVRASATSTQTGRKVEGVEVEVTFNDSIEYSDNIRLSLKETELILKQPFPDSVKILNYKGNFQNIHPKVLHFASGLWGFKFWMAYTPFPYEWDQDENPCIAVSNDGENWITPPGLINPLAYAPPNGYNSDTHLVWRADTQTLECWYRPYNNLTSSAKLVRRMTTDGVNWSQQEDIVGIDGVLSPSILFEGGKYKLWYPNASKKIYYTESSGVNPSGWSTPLEKTINIYAWHMDVIRTPKGLEYLIQGWEEGKGSNFNSGMFYMLEDGVSPLIASKILSINNLPGDPSQYEGLYRGSILLVDGQYKVYYSYIRNDRYQGMMLAKGEDIYRLLPNNRELSKESEVIVLTDDESISELYVHSARTIHVKDCNVVINAFTGLQPNGILDIVVTGSGSCQLVNGTRISNGTTITLGKKSVLALDSRSVIVI